MGYAYFDYRDHDFQSSSHITASLLSQIAATKSSLPTEVVEVYKKSGLNGSSLASQDAERVLVVSCQAFRRVFIVIDALDECDEIRHRKNFIRVLENLRQRPEIRLFITSRFYPADIKKAFEHVHQITVRANEVDLAKFISHEIDNSNASDLFDEKFKTEVIHRISRGAQDM